MKKTVLSAAVAAFFIGSFSPAQAAPVGGVDLEVMVAQAQSGGVVSAQLDLLAALDLATLSYEELMALFAALEDLAAAGIVSPTLAGLVRIAALELSLRDATAADEPQPGSAT